MSKSTISFNPSKEKPEKMPDPFEFPWFDVIVFLVICAIFFFFVGVDMANDAFQPSFFGFFFLPLFAWPSFWMKKDSRKHKMKLPRNLGLIEMPWYLYKTRGLRRMLELVSHAVSIILPIALLSAYAGYMLSK